MHGNPKRLRINGEARIERDDPLLSDTIGAQLIIRIKVNVIFPKLYSLHDAHGTLGLCSPRRDRSRRTSLEGIRRVQGCRAVPRWLAKRIGSVFGRGCCTHHSANPRRSNLKEIPCPLFR
jgi:hypothetical protein